MSNLTDFLKAIGEQDNDSIEAAGSLLGLLADVSGGVGFLQLFLTSLQPADMRVLDAFTTLQTTITQGISNIETEIAAQSILTKMDIVDSVMDPAKSVFASLPAAIPELPNDALVFDAITKCVTAVQSLTDDGAKWEVVWAAPVTYTDGWSGNLLPPHNDFVFNYIYTLPNFLHAIAILLTAVTALEPTAMATYMPVLVNAVNKLQSVHDTIASPQTLVGTKLPNADDVASLDRNLAWSPNWLDGIPELNNSPGAGDPHLWPFGAVEEYSAMSIVDSYWPFLPFQIDWPIPDNFINLVQLRIENRKKLLYRQLGLPVVRQSIKQLSAITGQPVVPAPPFEGWSFREAFAILGIPLPGPGAFRSLVAFLQSIPPYSGGVLHPAALGDRFPQSPLPRSFRSLFIA